MRRKGIAWASSPLICTAVLACAGSASHPSAPADLDVDSASDAAPSPRVPVTPNGEKGDADDGGYCSGLSLDGSPVIKQMFVAAPPPTPTAGSTTFPFRWTYLAEDIIYTDVGGQAGPTGVSIRGGMLNDDGVLSTRIESEGVVEDTSGAYALSYTPVAGDNSQQPNTLTYSIVCPSSTTRVRYFALVGPALELIEFLSPNHVRRWM